ncbi:MAG: hypothetical protein ACPGWR_13665 [Ardenticatenaceae bacterium]
MSAHVEIRLVRGNFDDELSSIRAELQDLKVTVPVNIPIPREQILAAARQRRAQQVAAQQAGGGGPVGSALPPVLARDQGMPGVGVSGHSRSSGPLFGFGNRDPSFGDVTLNPFSASAAVGANEAMARGMLATNTNARFAPDGPMMNGNFPYPSDYTGVGFGGWASKASTDTAPDAAMWGEFFKSYFNRGDDPRFKARGGILGEGAGEGIDYTETFMHMASRTMEDLSVKVMGRPAMMLEDWLEEPAALALGMRTGSVAGWGLSLRESRKMRIEGEREYNRWLNRSYLPENAATMADEFKGTIGKASEEYLRALNIFQGTAEGGMEIFSPSRRMKRLVGEPWAEGFAGGIAEGAEGAKQSARGAVRGAINESRGHAYSAAQRSVTVEHRAASSASQGGGAPVRTKPATMTHFSPQRAPRVQPVSVAPPPRPPVRRTNRTSLNAHMSMPQRRSSAQPWQIENNYSNVPETTRMDIQSGINRAMRAMRQGAAR